MNCIVACYVVVKRVKLFLRVTTSRTFEQIYFSIRSISQWNIFALKSLSILK